jgi:nitroreductase
MYETLNILKRRRSVRSYLDKQISDDELNAVLEAGIYAPSGSGQIEEFIHFAVVQEPSVLLKINKLAKEFAGSSAMEHMKKLAANEKFSCFYNAPTLIIVSYNERWIQPEIDCAAATENMLIAAEALGLGACWLYFPLQAFLTSDGNALLSELHIPAGFKPITSFALGYKGNELPNPVTRVIKNISYVR